MDNSPTGLFDNYEQDFRQLIQGVRQKLEGDAKEERGGRQYLTYMTVLRLTGVRILEQRKAELRRVDMDLDEADEMVCYLPVLIAQDITARYRSRKWRSKYKEYRNPSDPLSRHV